MSLGRRRARRAARAGAELRRRRLRQRRLVRRGDRLEPRRRGGENRALRLRGRAAIQLQIEELRDAPGDDPFRIALRAAVTTAVIGAVAWFPLQVLFDSDAMNLWVLLALGAAAIVLVLVVAPTVGVEVLKPYQVDRLTAFANPSENPAEEGYQQTQSRIAIGAGRKTGRGLERATQTKLNFLPEHHTDFIFAVVGESFGFLGAACVLSLFALLLWRTLRILVLARNLFGALLAGGIAAILMFQIFVNVGMMPITGVPLPLMSAGGSSALVTFICLGLLQSIYAHSRNVADRKVAA